MEQVKENRLESENAPKELQNQIVYLRGALEPTVMTVWQSQVLGSYGTVVLENKQRIMVIAHLEKDEESDNPFDKKITWWRDAVFLIMELSFILTFGENRLLS